MTAAGESSRPATLRIPSGMAEQVALAPLTSMGVGGPARFYSVVTSERAVREVILWARERGIPWMILGGGSNLLIGDGGFDGLVIDLQLRGVDDRIDGTEVWVTAAAGEPWDAFVAHTVKHGWGGIETLSGIPGRVGATPIQNVGAYGQEVRETITEVRTYDSVDDRIVTFNPAACAFAYRNSYFKSQAPGRHVVLAVTYRLQVGGAPTVRYAELARALEATPNPTLRDVRETVLAVRRKKSMVLDENDPNSRSCGSFFVNPVVSEAEYKALAAREMPHYPAPNGVKLSAAWLIEQAGFGKGFIKGRAGLSQNHCLAVINRGEANAADILALVEDVRAGVREKFGVTLVPEPVFVGL